MHTSDITNASHNSTITKVTNNTIINKGIGFSHSMNSQVKFKKLIKKNTQTNDVITKIYIKDKNDNYKLHSKIISKILS